MGIEPIHENEQDSDRHVTDSEAGRLNLPGGAGGLSRMNSRGRPGPGPRSAGYHGAEPDTEKRQSPLLRSTRLDVRSLKRERHDSLKNGPKLNLKICWRPDLKIWKKRILLIPSSITAMELWTPRNSKQLLEQVLRIFSLLCCCNP
jgi:hypothetical protein